MKPLRIAGVGCGERTWIYMQLMADRPEQFTICAASDPVPEYRERVRGLVTGSEVALFDNADDFFSAGKIADVVIIGTQDDYHYDPCRRALEMGYDILLEKPIAQKVNEVVALEKLARELNRRVMICHVFRYNTLFNQIKDLLGAGAIGEIVSMNAVEGVEPWHQAHSFVRGHWSVTEKSNPMIMAKCCHDLDLLSWMIGADCRSVSSFGSGSYFNTRNAPDGVPLRCTDGCPVVDRCHYSALRYLEDKKSPWLGQVLPHADTATDENITDWLRVSPWGRCVYHCDNDTVDHQTLNLVFENDVTCTFTMTAFESGRYWDIYGTDGTMKIHHMGDDTHGDAPMKIVVKEHHTAKETVYPVAVPEQGHRFHHDGGDEGLVDALYEEMTRPSPQDLRSSITKSLQSHLMAFAAERSRQSGELVHLSDLAL